MRDSAIMYRSFYEAINTLPKTQQADAWQAVFEYAFNFKEIELNGRTKAMFMLIKPQLDANNKRYKNGKKPKLNRSGTEANSKQNSSKTEANKNEHVNDNENENNNSNDNNHVNEYINAATQYKTPALFLKENFDLGKSAVKSGLVADEFERCLTQWSLKCEERGWKYSADKEADLRMLRAGFLKWLNSWREIEKRQGSENRRRKGRSDTGAIRAWAREVLQRSAEENGDTID
jgi:hypothetical protein